MRHVLVTGTSSGIGAATALRLAGSDYHVFAGVRDLHDAEPLKRGNSDIDAVQLDVTDTGSIAAAIEQIRLAIGEDGLYGLVNNAGEGVPGPMEMVELDQLRLQFEVNVIGQVALTQQALPLIRQAHGRVVFVSSVGGRVASQFAGPYHASKFALEAIGDAWRQELKPEEVDVILIEPGVISTPIWSKAAHRVDDLLTKPAAQRYADRLRDLQETMHRAGKDGGDPKDVAEVIESALDAESPHARYTVGLSAKVAPALRWLLPDNMYDKLANRTAPG